MKNPRYKYWFKVLPAVAIYMATTLAGCSDEDFSVHNKNSRLISFNVVESGENNMTRSGRVERADGALSTVTLNSSGNKLYLIPEIEKGIGISASGQSTRGLQVTATSIQDFGVYASTGVASTDDAGYYMKNIQVTRDNDWTPKKEYLWPGNGSLHFVAYSPYCPDLREIADEGIISLPSDSPSATPMISYMVPADVTSQEDLMWATPVEASSSPCSMEFNHALAAVRFATGPEMAECTVKKISISGLTGSGKLNLENGVWSDMEGEETYTADLNVKLSAAEGESNVAEKTPITDDEHTFMLLPQTLGKNVSLTMTIDCNGAVAEFTASLAGQVWTAGNTYTYYLSANPEIDRFVLSVASPLSFNYTGGTQDYTVSSKYESLKNGVMTTAEVPWIAEFVDGNGNVIPTPDWITNLPMSGNGTMDCEAQTEMVEPTFVSMSEPTRLLRSKSSVGSPQSPYNLSNSSGAATIENTANCYIINAPGSYSLPLVYGNAIKNGVDNTAAYAPNRSNQPFVNHLGNRIQKPYIYDNTGCSDIAGAKLIWEGRLNMIRNLRLSPDKKRLEFEITPGGIRQGNAVVGIYDSKGEIMWSWQLWITDYVLGENLQTVAYNGVDYQYMPYNLGNVVGGDETDFASNKVLLRFTQKPLGGGEGQSLTITVQQTGKHIITPYCHSFYQWGRKDPMISGIKEWYNADHTEITQIETKVIEGNEKLGVEFEAELVKSPQALWIYPSSGNPTFSFTDNWNLGTSARKVKTVYDPSPAGYMVPGNEIIAFRDMNDDLFSFAQLEGYSIPTRFIVRNNGTDIIFPALGYRSGKSGSETFTKDGAIITALWASHANTHEASALLLRYDGVLIRHTIPSDQRVEGFGIRSVKE
ncbi:MAG: fimbrillin family protein [Muribaculaceae bacterium]|nr:fimbrillin family protein [Muribaculaceae bacterium]